MKNIKMEAIEELKAAVAEVKKYRAIWEKIVEMFPTNNNDCDILFATEMHIRDGISEINDMLEDMFYDWSDITALKDEDEYYEREDAIRDEHESIAGVCGYIEGVADEVYETMGIVPVDFMQAFIAEFGIFKLVHDNEDVRIL